MKYRVFLLDNDGVLANSNVFHYEGYRDIGKENFPDIDYTYDEHMTLLGVSTHDTFVAMLKNHGYGDRLQETAIKEIVAKMEEEKKQDFQTRCENSTPEVLFPGIKEFIISAKKAGIILIVCSSSSSVGVMIKNTELLPYIDYVVDTSKGSVDCITPAAIKNGKIPGKPEPDLFLVGFMRGKEILPDLKKEEVLGFEDATNGVAAIKRAGIDALYIGDVNHPSNKKAFKEFNVEPNYVVSHSSELTLAKVSELIDEKTGELSV
ncbi:MAG: HAD family hydrolase [Spirochaetales bacterium]